MWYRGSVSVPANTLQSALVTADIAVCRGVISKFYRLFPPGCMGQVHLQVFYQTRQLFPTTPGQSYVGDGSEILGDASIVLDEPEFVLQLRAWSSGTSYDHILYCEFYIASPVLSVPVPLSRPVLPGL